MALSRISFSDSLLNTFTRISRTAACIEVQHARSATIHRKRQALHVTSTRYYPDPPTIALPNNVRDIFANETGRFTSERARDIALYTENGIAADCSGFPKIQDNGHMDAYDCFGAVSLNGTMQSNVPKPFSSHGKSTHLNMPGGQWSRDGKYIAEDMQRSHYRKLSYTATNAFITSPFLRATYQPIHTIRMGFCCSTNRFEALKDANKDQTAMPTMISKREKFRLMLRDYGGTLLAFHITISLISLGGCYMLVISGIDVMPLVQTLTGGNEQLDNLMKTSTDFVLAYTVHKLLAPVRISISLTVTPILVRHLRKIGLLKMPKAKKTTPPSL